LRERKRFLYARRIARTARDAVRETCASDARKAAPIHVATRAARANAAIDRIARGARGRNAAIDAVARRGAAGVALTLTRHLRYGGRA